jgi:hypothetical protein
VNRLAVSLFRSNRASLYELKPQRPSLTVARVFLRGIEQLDRQVHALFVGQHAVLDDALHELVVRRAGAARQLDRQLAEAAASGAAGLAFAGAAWSRSCAMKASSWRQAESLARDGAEPEPAALARRRPRIGASSLGLFALWSGDPYRSPSRGVEVVARGGKQIPRGGGWVERGARSVAERCDLLRSAARTPGAAVETSRTVASRSCIAWCGSCRA